MKRMKHKIIGTILTASIVMSSSVAFANATVFTDIGGHWAKEFVEDIYDRKITTGYPDATFRPQGNISKLESIVMIAKLMGYKDTDAGYYINQYKDKLQKNNIPEWGQGPTAYALFNDIILEKELPELVSTANQTHAKRHEVATYIGRVLQYGAGEKISSIYVIPYVDEMSIPTEAGPYIDLLLRNSILDKSSNGGRFLPNNLITRAEVSKLISLSAEILDKASTGTTPPPTTPPPTSIHKKTVSGDIDNIILGTKNIISIAEGKNKTVYDISEKVKITLDGKNVSIADLSVGQQVTATVENDIITDIKASTVEDILEGYFYYYLDGAKPSVYISDSEENIKILLFTSKSKIYLNDKAAKISDLKTGDTVSIKHMDGELIELNAESKEKVIEGVVKSTSGSKDKYTITIALKDNAKETYTVNSKATLKRDKKTVEFDEIKVGDEVEIGLEYDEVKYINAYSVQRTEKGYIKSIILGQKTEITIEKYDGGTEKFEITPNTTIKIEEQKATIYDLRIGYEVELEMENNEVVWMESYRKIQGMSYQGRVKDLDTRADTINLEIKAGNEVVIEVDRDTIYNDENGKLIRFRDINEDDEIVVYAEDNGYYILAKRVFIVIRRK
ncbi:S-layer homology domain-containing protein [Alkaliphilus oremlandii]|uniref:S-layer domain protein n=1 Tax=Alkaliphilus oremlandii (strain OhILAs) TaxID=350688 RepID=A8MK00_ALKOO|nr:S-layer homology domain-containing protein [Alkaliphilus oremlandii]ABW20132.1 S-layer domain protein [Alkaliphilus oremlandii OhILAs]